jgi:PAS domain S-box-containing protein
MEEPQEWTDGIIDELSFRPPHESDGLQLNLLRDHKPDQDPWETEEQLRVVADALPGLIAYVDAQLRYRFNNKSFWDWFGLSPQEMRGRHMKEFLGDATYEGIRPYIEAVLAGHTVRFEQITSCKDASNRHVTVCYIPDLTADGKVRGFFAVIRDITAEKEREEKEREHLLELSHAARLATVGEMVTEIAHEINQPLAAIANYSGACLQAMPAEQTSQPIRKWLESINVQAKRASQIVHRLRSFVSKGRIKRTTIDLNTLVREMVDFTQIETRKHGISVKLELSRTPCWVIADKVLVEQVLINLIRNAIEALAGMDCQERRLRIKTTHQGDSIAVAVCDNGLGIPPELGERIFASFVTTKANGLGMGLAISRSIVEANGGKLWASSSLSEGTVFTFTLPLAGGERHVTSTTTHGLCRR